MTDPIFEAYRKVQQHQQMKGYALGFKSLPADLYDISVIHRATGAARRVTLAKGLSELDYAKIFVELKKELEGKK